MTKSSIYIPKSRKRDLGDGLSLNHNKNIKYRLRLQTEKEAEEDIKDFKDNVDDDDKPGISSGIL